jgi:putative spermidine/putrescine transport system ATP-binding protein
VVANGKVMVVRPERIRVVAPGAGRTSDSQVRISGVVREVIYLGSARKYVIELEDRTLTKARGPIGGDQKVAAGDRVDIVWDRRDAILLDESGAA